MDVLLVYVFFCIVWDYNALVQSDTDLNAICCRLILDYLVKECSVLFQMHLYLSLDILTIH